MTNRIQTLQFRAVQLGTPRHDDEGLRIGAVRFLPRGVPKNEYASRNLFDLWLPGLAPSRELLADYRDHGLTVRRFFQRYRQEMSLTDARQTIQLFAEMAKQTPLSIGCYCHNESMCHRSVLSELIHSAAGVPLSPPWAEQSVYTIAHPDDLLQIHQGESGTGTRTEQKRWTTAEKLLRAAEKSGERLAVLFADATNCRRLLYAARLDQIVIDGNETKYQFSGLVPLAEPHKPQELTLCSTGEKIAPGFIRPYAIVERPKFLPD